MGPDRAAPLSSLLGLVLVMGRRVESVWVVAPSVGQVGDVLLWAGDGSWLTRGPTMSAAAPAV